MSKSVAVIGAGPVGLAAAAAVGDDRIQNLAAADVTAASADERGSTPALFPPSPTASPLGSQATASTLQDPPHAHS